MVPPAPPRFSVRNDWPVLCRKPSASNRAWMSVPPPVPNGTMTRTALAGQLWPDAAVENINAMLAAASAEKYAGVMRLMDFLLDCFGETGAMISHDGPARNPDPAEPPFERVLLQYSDSSVTERWLCHIVSRLSSRKRTRTSR